MGKKYLVDTNISIYYFKTDKIIHFRQAIAVKLSDGVIVAAYLINDFDLFTRNAVDFFVFKNIVIFSFFVIAIKQNESKKSENGSSLESESR